MSYQANYSRQISGKSGVTINGLVKINDHTEKVSDFIKLSRFFQDKIYNSTLSTEYINSIVTDFDNHLTELIRKGIKYGETESNEEAEKNVQSVLQSIRKTANNYRCKVFTVTLIFATAYCHEEENVLLIPIIRVEWKNKFTVDFFSKLGKKFNSVNELIDSVGLPHSLVCFPKYGKYVYDQKINGIALEFSTVNFYKSISLRKRLFSILEENWGIVLPVSVFGVLALLGVKFLTNSAISVSARMIASCGIKALKTSWSLFSKTEVWHWLKNLLLLINCQPLLQYGENIVKAISNAHNAIERVKIVNDYLFSGLTFFRIIALKLASGTPSIFFKTEELKNEIKTGPVFQYPFRSTFHIEKIYYYEPDVWKSYICEILERVKTLEEEKQKNFKHKLWFLNCYTQEQTSRQYSEGKNSLNEFLKSEDGEMEKNDYESIHNLDYIVIYHNAEEKKCVYIFQTELKTLISHGKPTREHGDWTDVMFENSLCSLRQFSYKEVEYVCVVEDYSNAEIILPWGLFLNK